jgi:cytochrome c nitrite reductase small subunit
MNDLFREIKGDYPVFIGLSAKGRMIADANCLRCHFSAVERTSMVSGGQDCLKCHRHLVHGKGPDR